MVHKALGDLAMDLGENDEAIREFLTSLDLHQNPVTQIHLGRAYVAAGKQAQASSAFDGIDSAGLDSALWVKM